MLDSIHFLVVESAHRIQLLIFRCPIDCNGFLVKVWLFACFAFGCCANDIDDGMCSFVFIAESVFVDTLALVSIYSTASPLVQAATALG